MDQTLPFSPASERNKAPILAVLREVYTAPKSVLEIGSGTGQHAEFFAQALPHLQWIPSETPERLAGLEPRLAQSKLANLAAPRVLDVTDQPWSMNGPMDGPLDTVHGVFAANVAHIMGWPAVVAMFAGVGRIIEKDGAFCLYGPFNYDGHCTSDSNAAFDADLRGRDPAMGLRDLADLKGLAQANGLTLEQDHAMPANNRLLVWRRVKKA